MTKVQYTVEDFIQKIADHLGQSVPETLDTIEAFGKDLQILKNRQLFLSELRSGKFRKGTIKSDEKGNPVIENGDDSGHCCCAIAGEMFGETESGKISLPKAMKALGLNSKDCAYIQQEINDNDSTLQENADRIESEVFKKKNM